VNIAGDLHFANVNMTDARGGLEYKCNVRNVVADTVKAGSYSTINVIDGHTSVCFYNDDLRRLTRYNSYCWQDPARVSETT